MSKYLNLCHILEFDLCHLVVLAVRVRLRVAHAGLRFVVAAGLGAAAREREGRAVDLSKVKVSI